MPAHVEKRGLGPRVFYTEQNLGSLQGLVYCSYKYFASTVRLRLCLSSKVYLWQHPFSRDFGRNQHSMRVCSDSHLRSTNRKFTNWKDVLILTIYHKATSSLTSAHSSGELLAALEQGLLGEFDLVAALLSQAHAIVANDSLEGLGRRGRDETRLHRCAHGAPQDEDRLAALTLHLKVHLNSGEATLVLRERGDEVRDGGIRRTNLIEDNLGEVVGELIDHISMLLLDFGAKCINAVRVDVDIDEGHLWLEVRVEGRVLLEMKN